MKKEECKIVAVIPVKGRIPLLPYTISRLYKNNGIYKVICIGESREEEIACTNAGAEFIYHEHGIPLGFKWNRGFLEASKYSPDACLFVGSSDWVSDNWLPTIAPYLKKYDLIGKRDFYMMDVANEIRVCHWLGYSGVRADEPIGIGRVITARILDKMKWRPFDPSKNNSMDYQMFKQALKLGGKPLLLQDDSLLSLSISTNKWANMHQFEDHWNDKIPSKSNRIENKESIMKLFPEGEKLYADLRK